MLCDMITPAQVRTHPTIYDESMRLRIVNFNGENENGNEKKSIFLITTIFGRVIEIRMVIC